MTFNSLRFIPFVLTVLGLYYCLPPRFRTLVLLAAGYVFYAAWDYRLVALILAITLANYSCGLALSAIDAPLRRRTVLVICCIFDLGVLGVFKYYNFFVESAEIFLEFMGVGSHWSHLNVVLPLGISFYTFQTLGYIIDVYHRRVTACRELRDFALFVAFFPQMVAGPIERGGRLIPQIQSTRAVGFHQVGEALWLLLIGYFQKMVIADNLAGLVDGSFGKESAPGGFECLLATYSFTFQIYADFAGCSNIARGLAGLVGIDLMINFNRPYFAASPREFWHRWHISLSTWLRDYLYIPLGGNRKGAWTLHKSLLITMTLGGLWHGAAWTFVFWGVFHGVLLSAQRLLIGRGSAPLAGWKKLAGILVTFQLVSLGWLIFRARSLEQAFQFLISIGTDPVPDATTLGLFFPLFVFGGAMLLLDLWNRDQEDVRRNAGWNRGVGPALCTALLLALFFLSASGAQQFIYMRF